MAESHVTTACNGRHFAPPWKPSVGPTFLMENQMGILDRLLGSRSDTPHCYLCTKEGHLREMQLVSRVMMDMQK